MEVELKAEAKVIGLNATNKGPVYAYSDGTICFISDFQSEESEEKEVFDVGKNEGWLRGFMSPYEAHQYCMIGKSLPPVLIDIDKEVVVWRGKNVPHDELDLKVPIHDIDGLFFNEGNSLAICHKDRKIRLYDVKKGQKRPTLDKQYSEEKTNFTKMNISPCKNYIYFGNAQGSVFVADFRKDLKVVNKIKGANGTIKGIACLKDYVMTGSLDGYVRLYGMEDYKQVTQIYIGHPIYSLFADGDIDEEELEQQQEEDVPKPKIQKRKNTIALPYLQPRKQAKTEAKA